MGIFNRKDWLSLIPFTIIGVLFAVIPVMVFIGTGWFWVLFVAIVVGLFPIVAGGFVCVLCPWLAQRDYKRTGALTESSECINGVHGWGMIPYM